LENYRNKIKVLVTGGSGQVGSHLKQIYKNINCSFLFPTRIELDLSSKKSIFDYLNKNKPDLIINLAAFTKVDQAEIDQKKAYTINYMSVVFLSEYVLEKNISLINFSTDYVFNDTSGPYKTNSSRNPINYYGYTKNIAEKRLEDLNDNFLTIRLASVFSEYGHNFVKTITNLLLENKEINVVYDQKISITYAGDAALFIAKLINNYIIKGNFNISNKVFHFTNNGYTEWYSVAKVVHRKLLDFGEGKNAIINRITSNDWSSMAKRPNDSRLYLDNDWFNDNDMIIPKWELRVEEVVSSIILNKEKS
tara:strand:- start:1381 stop:2301 length:921 start_codon:yes stop_codon:yes gene_type:complete